MKTVNELLDPRDFAYVGQVVYRCYGATGALLYVGWTRRSLRTRMKDHKQKAAWYPACVRVVTERHALRLAALDAERRAIHFERPTHNIAGRAYEFPEEVAA